MFGVCVVVLYVIRQGAINIGSCRDSFATSFAWLRSLGLLLCFNYMARLLIATLVWQFLVSHVRISLSHNFCLWENCVGS